MNRAHDFFWWWFFELNGYETARVVVLFHFWLLVLATIILPWFAILAAIEEDYAD